MRGHSGRRARASTSRATRCPSGVCTGRYTRSALQSGAVKVGGDVKGDVEHRRVLRTAVPLLEVAAVVRDEQERGARRDRLSGRSQNRRRSARVIWR